jgi:hypothetical protein
MMRIWPAISAIKSEYEWVTRIPELKSRRLIGDVERKESGVN